MIIYGLLFYATWVGVKHTCIQYLTPYLDVVYIKAWLLNNETEPSRRVQYWDKIEVQVQGHSFLDIKGINVTLYISNIVFEPFTRLNWSQTRLVWTSVTAQGNDFSMYMKVMGYVLILKRIYVTTEDFFLKGKRGKQAKGFSVIPIREVIVKAKVLSKT